MHGSAWALYSLRAETAHQGPDDFAPTFAAIEKGHSAALVILPSPLMDIHGASIADLAMGLRSPSIYPDPSFPHAGGLMSYGPNFFSLIKNETGYIDKIFKGAKPADLPVAQPTKFELVVNLKTSRTLGHRAATA